MKKQRGVALITVLLVFALITILCAQMIRHTLASLERSRWLVTEAQAYQYALAGEELARIVLKEQMDSLRNQGLEISPIPRPLPLYQPDNGQLSIEIIDLQGLINLNNALLDTTNQKTLRNLFSSQLLKPAMISELSDWLDIDLTPSPGGAEDYDYLSKIPPYRAANGPMSHPSELGLLADLSIEEYQSIAPFVTTLPQGTALNINTSPAEVLNLLDNKLSGIQIAAFRETSPPGFRSVSDFLTNNVTAGVELNGGNLTVTSNYYAAKIIASFEDQTVHLVSRFKLDNKAGTIELVDRILDGATQANSIITGNLDQDDESINSVF